MPYSNAGAVFPAPYTAGFDVPGAHTVAPIAHDLPVALLDAVGGSVTVALAAAAVLVIGRRWVAAAPADWRRASLGRRQR
jgi:type IV secretory pathway VirB2 component (pilin)